MRRAGSPAVVPSASLLHFLKQQLAGPYLRTSKPPIILCSGNRVRAPHHSTRSRIPSSSRDLTTTCPFQAEISSNFFDLGLVVPAPVCHSNLFGSLALSRSQHVTQDLPRIARQASTISRPILKRFWKRNGDRDQDRARKGHGLPPLPSFLDDAAGTSLERKKPGKPGSELKLRCTEIDENGNVTTVNGEFKKSELIAKVRRGTISKDCVLEKLISRYSTGFCPEI